MTVPPLAPRLPSGTVAAADQPELALSHTDSEWAALYPVIEQLYVRERRRLRYLMQYMEKEYAFKATVQMYKKRFAKWGFQKNARRSSDGGADYHRRLRRHSDRSGEQALLPSHPDLSRDDRLVLMILVNVRTWNSSFFESLDSGGYSFSQCDRIPTVSQLRQFEAKEASFAFKLVVDLLERGHGALAGRMARKAFLLAEDMLTLESPALVWNLLEMMHFMFAKHSSLFQMLLRHLVALAQDRMRNAHPFVAMLQGLQKLTSSLTGDTVPSLATRLHSPKPNAFPMSSGQGTSPRHSDAKLQSSTLPEVLKRAWVLNAEMLLQNFDPRLFPLYFRILYPTCDDGEIPATSSLLGAAKQWLSFVESDYPIKSSVVGETVGHHAMRLLAYTLHMQERTLQSLLTPLARSLRDTSPEVYDFLRASRASAGQRGRGDRAQHAVDMGDSASVRMLAVLATAKVLATLPQADPGAVVIACFKCRDGPLDPRRLALAITTLIELDNTGVQMVEDGTELLSAAAEVQRARAIVTLREFAEGLTDPQVVRDMWLLQDALAAAGRYEEALEVESDAYRRMERYIEDIPVDSV